MSLRHSQSQASLKVCPQPPTKMKFLLSVVCFVVALQACSAAYSQYAAVVTLSEKLPALNSTLEENINNLTSILAVPQKKGNNVFLEFVKNATASIYNVSETLGVNISSCTGVEEALSELVLDARRDTKACLGVTTSAMHATLKDLKAVRPYIANLISVLEEHSNSTCDPLAASCTPMSIDPHLKKARVLFKRVEKASKKIQYANSSTMSSKVGSCVEKAMAELATEAEAIAAMVEACA